MPVTENLSWACFSDQTFPKIDQLEWLWLPGKDSSSLLYIPLCCLRANGHVYKNHFLTKTVKFLALKLKPIVHDNFVWDTISCEIMFQFGDHWLGVSTAKVINVPEIAQVVSDIKWE